MNNTFVPFTRVAMGPTNDWMDPNEMQALADSLKPIH